MSFPHKSASKSHFQLSLPTPANTVFLHVDYAYREQVEPLYMERLLQNLRCLQDTIPARDLAIQFDVAIELAYIEYDWGRIQNPFWIPYFSSIKETIIKHVTQLSSAIDQGVQLGFHLCYGAVCHEHFVQPEDAGQLVELATSIAEHVGPVHPIQWIHFPVPKDRLDVTYFEPLKNLDIGETELFQGLVHPHDQDGTEQRVKAAQAVYLRSFGVATECGMGRTPLEDIDSIYEIARNITSGV